MNNFSYNQKKIIVCPYKSLSGLRCHHRYAEKDKRLNVRGYKTICRYSDDPTKCQLYRLWKEEIDNLDSKSENTISKEVTAMINKTFK